MRERTFTNTIEVIWSIAIVAHVFCHSVYGGWSGDQYSAEKQRGLIRMCRNKWRVSKVEKRSIWAETGSINRVKSESRWGTSHMLYEPMELGTESCETESHIEKGRTCGGGKKEARKERTAQAKRNEMKKTNKPT